jgi:hypothetical protein
MTRHRAPRHQRCLEESPLVFAEAPPSEKRVGRQVPWALDERGVDDGEITLVCDLEHPVQHRLLDAAAQARGPSTFCHARRSASGSNALATSCFSK